MLIFLGLTVNMVQFKDFVIRTLVLFILVECSLSLEEKPV